MKVTCPVATCGAENDAPVTLCRACGADLHAYAIALRFNDFCFNRGLERARAGDLEAARQELAAAIGFRPGDHEAILLLGKVHWAAGQKAEAEVAWQRALSAAHDATVKEQALACLRAAAPGTRAKEGRAERRRSRRSKGRKRRKR